jgi:hypothetical protein
VSSAPTPRRVTASLAVAAIKSPLASTIVDEIEELDETASESNHNKSVFTGSEV